MTKSEIREIYKSKRNELSIEQIESMSLDIANKTLEMDIWNHTNYHLFMSILKLKEVNTEYLLHILQGKDKNVIVSKSDFSNYSMTHFLLTDSTAFKMNRWNIPEPIDGFKVETSQIDVIFIPLLIFDLNGYRAGYGKGFYDRFLSMCKPESLKIGLSFFDPIQQIDDVDDTDIALDFVITPEKVFSFNN